MSIGFDKQHDAGERIFYNVMGDWIPNTDHHGSLMIRPYFGDNTPTGFSDETFIKPRIYPNPTTGVIRVEGMFERLTVYDLLGNTLIDIAGSETTMELDLGNFKEGIYIIRGFTNGEYFTEKILKQR